MDNIKNTLQNFTITILKSYKDKLNIFNSLSDEDKRYLIYDIYGDVPIIFPKIGGELTKAFLKIGLNPLDYIPFVPDFFLYGCTDISEVIIPKHIDEINDQAFEASGIDKINLPENLDIIHQSAFSRCMGLKEIALPDNIQTIPVHCFSFCANLKTVKLPKNLYAIEHGAFTNCFSLENLTYPGTFKDFKYVVLENTWKEGAYRLKQITCSDGVFEL